MATSYSQTPDPNQGQDTNPENQQKGEQVVAQNTAARRALPWVIAAVVLVAVIV